MHFVPCLLHAIDRLRQHEDPQLLHLLLVPLLLQLFLILDKCTRKSLQQNHRGHGDSCLMPPLARLGGSVMTVELVLAPRESKSLGGRTPSNLGSKARLKVGRIQPSGAGIRPSVGVPFLVVSLACVALVVDGSNHLPVPMSCSKRLLGSSVSFEILLVGFRMNRQNW